MTGGPGAGKRAWSDDERDAGAGQRDQVAGERDAAADARDTAADQRDQLADAREAELEEDDARSAPASEGRDRDRSLRQAARTERERLRAIRDTAAGARSQAAQRRVDGARVTRGTSPRAGAAADPGDDADRGERSWAADKRDFVADWRDRIADERDTAADQRDQLADAREAELDEWEARLAAARGAGPGPAAGRTAQERVRDRSLREAARTERERLRAGRDAAASARHQAAQHRTDSIPASGLAMAFAEIARHLYDAENLDDVVTRIAAVSVSAVPGCEMASIIVREDGAFRTVASTHEAATAVDNAQYEAGEGPCLSAVEEAVIHTPAFPDPRWPTLGARPADLGVHAAVSYCLTPSGPVAGAPLAGSLNAYACVAGAFDDEAREIGLVLAAHASIAVRAVGDRDALEQLGRQLHAPCRPGTSSGRPRGS